MSDTGEAPLAQRTQLHTAIDKRLDELGCDCNPFFDVRSPFIHIMHELHCAAARRGE